MTHTLHPCPFCGGSDIETNAVPGVGDDEWIALAYCIDCGASGPQAAGYTPASGEQAAADAWNERRIMPKWSVMRRLDEKEA